MPAGLPLLGLYLNYTNPGQGGVRVAMLLLTACGAQELPLSLACRGVKNGDHYQQEEEGRLLLVLNQQPASVLAPP